MEVLFHSSDFLLPSPSSSSSSSLPDRRRSSTYALVLLNQRLPKFTPLLWKHAQLRLCADGGANRVFDEFPLMFPHLDALDVRNSYKPDVIRGDMDSIRTEVLEFYAMQGTKIFDESEDQDTTDLHKCVAYILQSIPNQESNIGIIMLSYSFSAVYPCCWSSGWTV
ncbi:thiamine pyrophosphokinase 2 isoform X2 [Cucumis sativus]|uniref:thiamine pyrophosphokinase 2 isoform X2 n=1 Tax=Cucumis sativus TaxID=3659 RepID=UPI0012F49003|nr:thiamine pyrophosphokinase 2 isoform X2 [Cucumis sativus]